jgi:hypothetical protein
MMLVAPVHGFDGATENHKHAGFGEKKQDKSVAPSKLFQRSRNRS